MARRFEFPSTPSSAPGSAPAARPAAFAAAPPSEAALALLGAQLEEGGSSKFWEVSVDGADMTVRYGRIGTNGQEKTKSFASEALAQKEADKLIAEKTRKGYAEVGAGEASAATQVATVIQAQPAPAQPAPPAAAPAPSPPATSPPATSPPATSPPAASAPAPSAARDAPTIILEGETIAFSAPDWTAERAQPALTDRISKKRGAPFERVWADLLAANQRYAGSDQTYRWAADPLVSERAKELLGRVRARLDARSQGEGFDIDLEGATYMLATLSARYDSDLATLAIWHWVDRSDPETAIRTMLRGSTFRLWTGSGRPSPLALCMPEEQPIQFALGGRQLDAIRQVLRAFGGGPLRDVVREAFQANTLQGRAQRAWLIEDREEALRLWGEIGEADHQIADLLPLLDDPAAAAALIPLTHDTGAILRSVRRLGLAVAPVIFERAEATKDDRAKSWAACLACYPSLRSARLLATMLASKPDRKLVADALANMPEAAVAALREVNQKKTKFRDVVEALIAQLGTEPATSEAAEPVEEAPLAELPKVLASPPWHEKRKNKGASAEVIDGLAPRALEPVIDLTGRDPQEIEREKQRLYARSSVANILDRLGKGAAVGAENILGLSFEDIEKLRAAGALSKLHGQYWYYLPGEWPGPSTLLFVHGTKILPALLELAPKLPPAISSDLAYAGAVEMGSLAAAWMGGKHTRKAAEAWVRRFPSHAAAGLIPLAVGPHGSARDRATLLLMHAARGHREAVLEQARACGGEVLAAVLAILDRDPLEIAPSKPPKLPEGLESLPRPTLRDGRALPRAAVRALLEMLAFSPLDQPYAGVGIVNELCDPKSLDRFVEALVRAWVANGMVTAHEWQVRAVALIGTDSSARFLFDRCRAWAADNAKARAMLALDVLGAMGSDLALSLVGRVSRSGQKQYLKDRATEILAEIAAARGLTPDELEDRTAPDLGLDESGTMVLDFGPRSFRVGFDEHLMPFVRGGEGEKLETLPRAAKSDDKDKAKAAWDAWKTLRAEAEKVAKDQVARLERMMGDERRVDAAIFFDCFVRHPLIGHLASKLVWSAWDQQGTLLATFRVAEDRTPASVDDDTYALPEGALVGVVHPFALREHAGLLERWGEQLADYEILQPFGQLARSATPVASGDVIARVSGKKAPGALLYSLRAHGWRADADEGGIIGYHKRIANTSYRLSISPALRSGEKALHTLSLSAHADPSAAPPSVVQLIELAHQLESVLAGG